MFVSCTSKKVDMWPTWWPRAMIEIHESLHNLHLTQLSCGRFRVAPRRFDRRASCAAPALRSWSWRSHLAKVKEQEVKTRLQQPTCEKNNSETTTTTTTTTTASNIKHQTSKCKQNAFLLCKFRHFFKSSWGEDLNSTVQLDRAGAHLVKSQRSKYFDRRFFVAPGSGALTNLALTGAMGAAPGNSSRKRFVSAYLAYLASCLSTFLAYLWGRPAWPVLNVLTAGSQHLDILNGCEEKWLIFQLDQFPSFRIMFYQVEMKKNDRSSSVHLTSKGTSITCFLRIRGNGPHNFFSTIIPAQNRLGSCVESFDVGSNNLPHPTNLARKNSAPRHISKFSVVQLWHSCAKKETQQGSVAKRGNHGKSEISIFSQIVRIRCDSKWFEMMNRCLLSNVAV